MSSSHKPCIDIAILVIIYESLNRACMQLQAKFPFFVFLQISKNNLNLNSYFFVKIC